MLDKLIQTRAFEKNGFYLRKHIPYFNKKYNYLNGINYKTLNHKYNAEIDSLISEAEQSLHQLTKVIHEKIITNSIPNKIWLYWNSPLASAPDVVKRSVQSWTRLNPDYDVIFLCDDNIEEILGINFNAVFRLATVNLGLALKADILRLYLLKNYGGIWADTTTFCLQPLDKWLPSTNKQSSFFTFRHNSNSTRPIEVWFIAVTPSCPVINFAFTNFIKHTFKPRTVSLYVSNKIEKIGKNNSDEAALNLEDIISAEKLGFMPYFSLGYLLNNGLEQNKIKNTLTKTTNNHSVNNDCFDTFRNSLVSKQTYKKDYQNSDIYKQRVEYLEQLLSQ